MDEKPPKERDIEMGRRNSKNKSDYGLEDFYEEVGYLSSPSRLFMHLNVNYNCCSHWVFLN